MIDLDADERGSLFVPLEIGNVSVMALVDSGSTFSVMHSTLLDKIAQKVEVHRETAQVSIRMGDGGPLETKGFVEHDVRVGQGSPAVKRILLNLL